MRDDIFWSNLLGLLKLGKWNLTLAEATALQQIYDEVKKRSEPKSAVEQPRAEADVLSLGQERVKVKRGKS